MTPSARMPTYPLQVKDIQDYRAIYRPNVVGQVDDGGMLQPFGAPVADYSRTVVFKFDATNVKVKNDIVIARWDTDPDSGTLAWVEVARFGPESGIVTGSHVRNRRG